MSTRADCARYYSAGRSGNMQTALAGHSCHGKSTLCVVSECQNCANCRPGIPMLQMGSRYIILEEESMNWKTPKIVEIALGAEINCYACADLK